MRAFFKQLLLNLIAIKTLKELVSKYKIPLSLILSVSKKTFIPYDKYQKGDYLKICISFRRTAACSVIKVHVVVAIHI